MRDVYALASNVLVLDAEFDEVLRRNKVRRDIYSHNVLDVDASSLDAAGGYAQQRNLVFQFAERALYVGVASSLCASQLQELDRNPWNLVA
jgi:hypothetical protein